MTSYRQVLGRKQTFSLLDIIHYKNVLRREIENYTLYKFIVNNFLLTEREVCTKKYRTKVFFVQTQPRRASFVQKDRAPMFFLYIQSKRGWQKVYNMAFICIYTWNKQEMSELKCILVAWYTFGRRKQKYQ
jgi:hypothetical protein